MCYDGLSASAPSGRKTADSEPFTVPGWSQLTEDFTILRSHGPFFLEIFAGQAGITEAVQLMGVPALPPVDVVVSDLVSEAADVLDLAVWETIMAIIAARLVFLLHCGTPCNTFTAARKDDGGPPPLRSRDAPLGLPGLSWQNQALVFMGNLFLIRTCEACTLVFNLGGNFTIENPLLSLMWATTMMDQLVHDTRALAVDFDQCAFGAPSKKPTRLLCSAEHFEVLQVLCPGGHVHESLRGKVFDPLQGKLVFKTKAAQVYPWALCAAFASVAHDLWQDPLHALQPSLQLTTPPADRKREVGSCKPWLGHKQEESALKALWAGYQLKRGAAKPLLHVEMEPGQAIEAALNVIHPFTIEAPLAAMEEVAVLQLRRPSEVIMAERARLLQFWHAQAVALLPHSVAAIRALPDPHLRRLLLGTDDLSVPRLGQVCHVALYEAMLMACGSVDQSLPSFLLHGFPIVGEIARSGRWPPYNKPQKDIPVQDALDRAWVLRKKIIQRVQSVQISDNLQKIWDASIEDVEEKSCLGPFVSEEEVTKALGCDDWIPTQRFEVVQKNKVRGCDSATTNMINQITRISEKLQLPSTDTNVAALRKLRTIKPGVKLAGWVLDERKAYRQVAVRPDHRKFSVICLKNPKTGAPNFFIMIGHSFGLVSAVYNYNRRSAAINEFLVSLFGLVAFSFYDDKYGFEPLAIAGSARAVAEHVHFWLGAKFDQKKLQLSTEPTILGVTYNLDQMQLEIKAERREEITQEIEAIVKAGILDPGSAGKLKGKLMFGASQLWGKVGRAFLRVISERQYLRFPIGSEFKLDQPLLESLLHWKKLVNEGPPRPIESASAKLVDAVIFTDGFTPDPRKKERLPDRVGAVLFDRRLKRPMQFTSAVSKAVKRRWLERSTQIVPVEMVAAVLALETFADRIRGSDILLLIDSEAVEGALIKGYSSREDLCQLISVFWDLAFQLRVRVFIDRISTDANPADWPSRNKLSIGEAAGWITVNPCWPKALFET